MLENIQPLQANVMEVLLSVLILSNTTNEQVQTPKTEYSNVQLIENPLDLVTPKKEEPAPAPPKEPVKHVVASGDNLSKIATQYNTNWKRLWDKNTNLGNPNIIEIGDTIVIPEPDEVIADRAVPAGAPASTVNTASRPLTGSTAGNGYDYGYCTWYVKNVRPDLPNNLGNANTWLARAQAQGFATGSTPQVGAVAWTGAGGLGHVAIVIAVSGNVITVREMNYNGFNVLSTRVTSAGEFLYIY